AVLPHASDEAAVPRGLQGPLPGLRRELEPDDVRLRAPVGGSPAGGLESAPERQRRCLIQSDAIRRLVPPSAGLTTRSRPCRPASARSATSPSVRTRCAPTAATTAVDRSVPSTRPSSRQLTGAAGGRSWERAGRSRVYSFRV